MSPIQRSCKAPKVILTEVKSHREAQGETGWDRVEHYCASTRWEHTHPINRTLSLHFCRFQFTKSSRQTINVCNANVKTSLTHIKSSQGHCKCALMLAWDQTGPIKCDLKQAGVIILRKQPAWRRFSKLLPTEGLYVTLNSDIEKWDLLFMPFRSSHWAPSWHFNVVQQQHQHAEEVQ